MKNKQFVSISSMFLVLTIGTNVMADTCPKNILQDSQGYWYSTEKPGWKSNSPTKTGIQLNVQDFGGVVYAPDKQRMACVYRDSQNQWIALVSEVTPNVQIDNKALDDSGKRPAWTLDEKYKYYTCGKPYITGVEKCPFTLGSGTPTPAPAATTTPASS